jgi:uncharacterized paraquat-inducible protein A
METNKDIPVAKIKIYAKWKSEHSPRSCPYCDVLFSVNLATDMNHIIYCPVCNKEIVYEKEI